MIWSHSKNSGGYFHLIRTNLTPNSLFTLVVITTSHRRNVSTQFGVTVPLLVRYYHYIGGLSAEKDDLVHVGPSCIVPNWILSLSYEFSLPHSLCLTFFIAIYKNEPCHRYFRVIYADEWWTLFNTIAVIRNLRSWLMAPQLFGYSGHLTLFPNILITGCWPINKKRPLPGTPANLFGFACIAAIGPGCFRALFWECWLDPFSLPNIILKATGIPRHGTLLAAT